MEKYTDNYGNEIEADYSTELPFGNKRDEVLAEEVWRRLLHIKPMLDRSGASELLQSVVSDLEYWMEANPIESPTRWEQ